MELRPYQREACDAVRREWAAGNRRTLLVMVTGAGKTICFADIAKHAVQEGERVLVLAHRGELLNQAADKIHKSTGLNCAVEKASESCLGKWERITVGSVQSLERESRLERFDPGYFSTIIVDEAHHALSAGYQKVLSYFDGARVLGVTATPDRGDMRNLGEYFDSLAYEYPLGRAIKEQYLCRILAQTVPLTLDISGVGVQNGDYASGQLGDALEPYMEEIAEQMKRYCADRKTVVFLPLVKTSQKFCGILNAHGFRAAEVNGNSTDRKEVLDAFEAGETNVLCNSMLLTEGWDCPSVDCVIVLRPTKVRSLYCQMVGRGTRLYPGKKNLLLLDFLWHTDRHDLMRPAHLVASSQEVADKMTANLEDGEAAELEEAEKQAAEDVVAEREAALAKQLAEMRRRKAKLVDPLQYAYSIGAEDLSGYAPTFMWEMMPATDKQLAALEKAGINPDTVENQGMASLILDRLSKRRSEGLATPKQIRLLENKGFLHVGEWSFDAASAMISRYAMNNWRTPSGVVPAQYVPEQRGGFYEPF